MREVGKRDGVVANLARDLRQFLMWALEKIFQQAELVHYLERRRMNRIATKVAQEIRVLLEHNNLDAGAREQKAEHHPGRAAAGNAATGVDGGRGIRHAGLDGSDLPGRRQELNDVERRAPR